MEPGSVQGVMSGRRIVLFILAILAVGRALALLALTRARYGTRAKPSTLEAFLAWRVRHPAIPANTYARTNLAVVSPEILREAIHALLVALTLAVVAGCSAPYVAPPLPPDHPANAAAAESPPPPKSTALMPETFPSGTMDQGAMGGGGMQAMDHGKMPGMKSGGDMKGMDHGKMPGMTPGRATQAAPAAPASGEMKEMDHGKMPGMKSGGDMKRMDHGKMPGMTPGGATQAAPAAPASGEMKEMDHGKMPGMKPDTQPQRPATGQPPPADKAAVAEEMKKTSDEMKKISDELKAKSDALQSKDAKPNSRPGAATPAPKPTSEHQQHQP